ncbi:hypothetical protein G6F62_015222 [Rhizopus arrhizus]|nr:hypothetical protein G6F62_015222 [Rhizopus arrhizus]
MRCTVVAWRQSAPARLRGVQRDVARRDPQRALSRHRIARIQAQVEEGVLQLMGIDPGGPQAGLAGQVQGDARPDAAPDQVFHAGDQPIDVGGFGVLRLAA